MNTCLNDFEVPLISLILKTYDPENKQWANILTTMQVSSREITGVGAYINFDGEIIVPDVPSGLGTFWQLMMVDFII